MTKNKKETNFESSLNKLELLVNKMESGEGTLEESLNWFEEGMGIIKLCQHELKAAEQKVEELIQNNETVSNKVD